MILINIIQLHNLEFKFQIPRLYAVETKKDQK
jgi:hypothetical protein